MKVPRVGQSVLADGAAGTFTVLKLNPRQGTADLELITGAHKIQMHLPFSAIHPLGEDVNQAAERIVNLK